MENSIFFPYSWHVDSEEENFTLIRTYGLNEQNRSVAVIIDDFTPYVYLELPDYIEWTKSKAQLVANKLDDILGKQKPIKKSLMMKKRLYYANMKGNQRRLFPYLFLSFATKKHINKLYYSVRRSIRILGLGSLKFKVHEQSASEVLQLTCLRDIPTTGWIQFRGTERKGIEKVTNCDYEFSVEWKKLSKYESDKVPKPLLMGMDIEVNSGNMNTFPKADRPSDKVFQISCVLQRQGDPSSTRKYLLSLGKPDLKTVGKDVSVRTFRTESNLLIGYTEFIREMKPNVVIGYNIFGFDIPYMIDRAKQNLVIFQFDQLGFLEHGHTHEKMIKWSSSAYKNQEFRFLDTEGRLHVDLLPVIKRDYKLANYRLKTVSEHILKNQTKDPLTPKGIFRYYRLGMKGNNKALGKVGRYCVQDSALVVLLFEKMQTWIGLAEMAKICNVNMIDLYTRGQQLKVYSQVYKECMYKNYVVEQDVYHAKEDERYQGAWVATPVPGVYDRVVPLDFRSLYPSVIIAYNIDWSTLVLDEGIPDSNCHVLEWNEHLKCVHDQALYEYCEKCEKKVYAPSGKRCPECKTNVRRKGLVKAKKQQIICGNRKYRFLKKPEGILPSLLKNLLDLRAKTKKLMKKTAKRLRNGDYKSEEEKVELEIAYTVFDKRQLAQKISCNSTYGAMGVRKGYLPFMVGAMSVTAMGRKNIQLTAEYIKTHHKGKLIYGD